MNQNSSANPLNEGLAQKDDLLRLRNQIMRFKEGMTETIPDGPVSAREENSRCMVRSYPVQKDQSQRKCKRMRQEIQN